MRKERNLFKLALLIQIFLSMRFQIEKYENYTLIEVIEEKLVSSNVYPIKSEMVLISNNGEKNIVLDLSKCRYCDNSVISTILVGNRLCKNHGGTFVLTGLNDSIERLIAISQLENVLRIAGSIPEAEAIIEGNNNRQPNIIRNIQQILSVSERVLQIEGTDKSPFVLLDPRKGMIIMKGNACPEDSYRFFRPILDFFSREFDKVHSIEGHFTLEYYSSTFSKALGDLFKEISFMRKNKVDVICNWYYEVDDYDTLEAGEDYETCTGLPFVFIEIPS